MAVWCLIKSEVDAFKKALQEKKINPFELADMSSEQRRGIFEKYVSKESAEKINSQYESKLLLKNRQKGFESWVKSTIGLKESVKRDLLSKIDRLSEMGTLSPKDLQDFKEDLVKTRLGLGITFEEAKTINELAAKRREHKDAWQAKLKEHPRWSTDPQATRSEWIKDQDRLSYGVAERVLKNYVDELKLSANKVSFKEDKILFMKDVLAQVPGTLKSLMASLDNSFFGRQGIKNLYGNLEQKKIWTRNFAKSFKDIGNELLAKKVNGLDPMDLIWADIYSRPNAVNGKYKAGDYQLSVESEEAFPSSLPEKIPGLRRLYKASETAFNGAAVRMRADLADMYISMMDKAGINTMDPKEAKGMGRLVGSLTGRGSLGKGEIIAKDLNVLLFSVKFFKSNIDTLTAHQFDKAATPYVKKQAAKNLLSIVAHLAGILTFAKLLDPESVDEDPRSTNFGKIKAFGVWADISGGLAPIVRTAMRIVPSTHNGEVGQWQKSSSGRWTNLSNKEFGQPTAVDTVLDAVLFNKLAPIAAIVHDALKGEMFGGEPFNIEKAITKSVIPLSIQQAVEANKSGSDVALMTVIAESLGFGTSTYQYKSYWEKSTSKEMVDFKAQVGQEKFLQSNEEYNNAYNVWLSEVETDPRFKKLSDDGKEDLKSKAKDAIKAKILKEYGYKKSKKDKSKDKTDSNIIKKLAPK